MEQPQPQLVPVQHTSTSPTAVPPAGALGSTDRGGPSLPEQDLWAGRMHWHNAMGRVFVWLMLNIAFLIVAWKAPRPEWLTQSRLTWTLLTLVAVTTFFFLGGVIIRILQTRYRLTSQRLFIERGILSRTMDQTELIRVDDVRMQQSFVQRIFKIGTVLMMTTDVTDKSVVIDGIKDPVRVAELIRQQMRTLRGKSLFVENL